MLGAIWHPSQVPASHSRELAARRRRPPSLGPETNVTTMMRHLGTCPAARASVGVGRGCRALTRSCFAPCPTP